MKKIFSNSRRKRPRPSHLRLVPAEAPVELSIMRPTWALGGIEYRNRLDYGWARQLQAVEESPEYRSRTVDLGDREITLPFFLPRVHQAIVTRPTLARVEREWGILRRVRAALAAEHPFPGDEDTGPVAALVVAASLGRFQGLGGEELAFVRCRFCRAWWFLDTAGWWGCRSCGAYDGTKHLAEWLLSPLTEIPASERPGDRPGDEVA